MQTNIIYIRSRNVCAFVLRCVICRLGGSNVCTLVWCEGMMASAFTPNPLAIVFVAGG